MRLATQARRPVATSRRPARSRSTPPLWLIQPKVRSTLMFAISSCRHDKSLPAVELILVAAAEQGWRHDPETTVDPALMRGLGTAGPDASRGVLCLESSVG